MSSIWKQFKNKRTYYDLQGTLHLSPLQYFCSSPRNVYTLIKADNAIDIAERFFQDKTLTGNLKNILPAPVRPPYKNVWLEWIVRADWGTCQTAVSVAELDNELFLQVFVSRDHEPCFVVYMCLIEINTLGEAQRITKHKQTARIDNDGFFAISSVINALFALSLLNCKNIRLGNAHDFHRKPKDKVKNYSEWKTLEISVPGVSTSANGKESEYVGLTRHHLVRGHFADYRNGPGMFGKESLRGVYWVCPHARGNAEHGSIIKDYSLKPAKEDPDE